ncbi:MAG: hypothetical protein RLZZ435_2572 [Cyanobacteriota bacterium]|jgi:hypothetical protein
MTDYMQEVQIEFIKSSLSFLKNEKGMTTAEAKDYLAKNTSKMFRKYMELRIASAPSEQDVLNMI